MGAEIQGTVNVNNGYQREGTTVAARASQRGVSISQTTPGARHGEASGPKHEPLRHNLPLLQSVVAVHCCRDD
jgi:hypothetical protein